MLVLCLTIAMATAGIRLSSTGGPSPRDNARLVFHVGAVASLSMALAFAGLWAPRFSALLMGAWFVGLAIIYAGHAVAVRYWGSPMSRDVLLFALRKFPYFAR